MSKELLIFLTLASFHQLNNAESINDVIKALTPKIRKVQAQVGLNIANGQYQIGLARSKIAHSVNEAEENVRHELDEFRELTNEFKNKAKIEGKDIEKCLEQADAAIKALDFNFLQNCRASDKLNLIGLKMGDLGELKGNLSRAIDHCSSKSTVPAEVTKFFQNQIDIAKTLIADFRIEIREMSKNAVPKSGLPI